MSRSRVPVAWRGATIFSGSDGIWTVCRNSVALDKRNQPTICWGCSGLWKPFLLFHSFCCSPGVTRLRSLQQQPSRMTMLAISPLRSFELSENLEEKTCDSLGGKRPTETCGGTWTLFWLATAGRLPKAYRSLDVKHEWRTHAIVHLLRCAMLNPATNFTARA